MHALIISALPTAANPLIATPKMWGNVKANALRLRTGASALRLRTGANALRLRTRANALRLTNRLGRSDESHGKATLGPRPANAPRRRKVTRWLGRG